MSLDLNPEVETQVLERARAAGTTASEYLAGLLRATPPPPPSTAAVPADDPVLAFLNAQLQDAQNATPEEIERPRHSGASSKRPWTRPAARAANGSSSPRLPRET